MRSTKTQVWKASLWTLEIGARGLVGLSTHKTFVRLGFTSSQAKALCKKLSTVVARSSYAMVQAHQNLAWTHKNLIVVEGPSARVQISSAVEGPLQPVQPCRQIIEQVDEFNNVKVNSIKSLFHFTDVSNSIRKN